MASATRRWASSGLGPGLALTSNLSATGKPFPADIATAAPPRPANLQRGLVGLRDLRGVAWLITRSRRTAVEER